MGKRVKLCYLQFVGETVAGFFSGKLKSRRTNTTTTDITTISPISEQRPQAIAHVT